MSGINFTDSAAAKVYELIKEEGNLELKLRVFITGGGCSGFQYGFTFEETINQDDTVIEKIVQDKQNGDKDEVGDDDDDEDGDGGEDGEGGGTTIASVNLLIDPMSFQYLMGAEIDYREDVNGAQFVIRNPNAKTTCGCGASFSS